MQFFDQYHAGQLEVALDVCLCVMCSVFSAQNNIGQSDNFRTILHISGQFNCCPDIVFEQLRKLESNLVKTVTFHYEVC